MPLSGRAGVAGAAVCAAGLDCVISRWTRERRRLRCRFEAVPALPVRPSAPPAWIACFQGGRVSNRAKIAVGVVAAVALLVALVAVGRWEARRHAHDENARIARIRAL